MENLFLILVIFLEVAIGIVLLFRLFVTGRSRSNSNKKISDAEIQWRSLRLGIAAGLIGGFAIGATTGNSASVILPGAVLGISLGLLFGNYFIHRKNKPNRPNKPTIIKFSETRLVTGITTCTIGVSLILILLFLNF